MQQKGKKAKKKQKFASDVCAGTFPEETYSTILWPLTVMLNCIIHLFCHNCTEKKWFNNFDNK